MLLWGAGQIPEEESSVVNLVMVSLSKLDETMDQVCNSSHGGHNFMNFSLLSCVGIILVFWEGIALV